MSQHLLRRDWAGVARIGFGVLSLVTAVAGAVIAR